MPKGDRLDRPQYPLDERIAANTDAPLAENQRLDLHLIRALLRGKQYHFNEKAWTDWLEQQQPSTNIEDRRYVDTTLTPEQVEMARQLRTPPTPQPQTMPWRPGEQVPWPAPNKQVLPPQYQR